jgi:hypothetical protein
MNSGITRMAFIRRLALLPLMLAAFPAFSQFTTIIDSSRYLRTVIPGKEYQKNQWHQWLWGEDYRKEWNTPATFPVLNMDSAYGGLTPFKQGGGRQTESLHLKDAKGRRYVMRSVNKTYTKALPEIARGTFIEGITNDQIATINPYAALTVPMMAEAAGVYHTNPKYYVVPNTQRLGEYRDTFANMLVLLEEHPDDTQLDVESFGHPEDIVSTEKMLENITEENDHLMDQHFYLKTRLFDMFLGDWSRHPDNWRWAKFDSGTFKIYRPVPKDRDQAYAKYEGFLLSLFVHGAGLKHLQTFDEDIRDVNWFNYPAGALDNRFTNQLTKQEWIDSAQALQHYLTDDVIENAVRQMPPSVFAESGAEIISKLKSRRNELVKYASEYYDFLAQQIDIPGSEQNEIFDVERLNDSLTSVRIYRINKHGEVKEHPTYFRIFSEKETKEIRLYGIDGNDIFHVNGSGKNNITIRIVGGVGKDSVINESSRVEYYDNPGNVVMGKVHAHLSTNKAINAFDDEAREWDKQGFILMPNYSNTRGVFVEAGFRKTTQAWRKKPFASQQTFKLNYSISNNSFGGDYLGLFNEVIGKWNVVVNARYDQVLKNYFFGFGNETPNVKEVSYYNLHTSEGIGSLGLNRIFAKYHSFTASAFFETVKVKSEIDHLTSEVLPLTDGTVFDRKNFAGALASYAYYYVNNEVVPTKGFGFSLNANHTKNLSQSDRWFNRYWTTLGFYLPLSKQFSIASRNGLYTLDGQPEFYQYNWLGGGQNLRGFHRQRFYGKTSFYNDNELRWIPDIKTYLFNGKIGLIAFLDNGRVWMPGENSDKWHMGYGGGLLISPFNKLAVTVYYGMSEEDKLIHIRLGKFF